MSQTSQGSKLLSGDCPFTFHVPTKNLQCKSSRTVRNHSNNGVGPVQTRQRPGWEQTRRVSCACRALLALGQLKIPPGLARVQQHLPWGLRRIQN